MFEFFQDNGALIILTTMFLFMAGYVQYVRHRDRTIKEPAETPAAEPSSEPDQSGVSA